MQQSSISTALVDVRTNETNHQPTLAGTPTLASDTVFEKHITKAIFNSLLDTLDTPLNKYATLLYPTLKLNKDDIQIHYSISIPVTDVGIGADIKFDKKGNYIFGQ